MLRASIYVHSYNLPHILSLKEVENTLLLIVYYVYYLIPTIVHYSPLMLWAKSDYYQSCFNQLMAI